MVSNIVYEELKKLKEKEDKSFSETIKVMIEKSKPKTGAELRDCLGLLPKEDKEYEEIFRELKPLYKKWTQRYV